MKVGIVGFPGSGKTTIFNALTGLAAATGVPAKGKENLGVIKVPDPRIDKLAELHASKKRVYAEISFIDVAAQPSASPAKGGGLDPQVLAAMRECDALVVVVRAFANPMLAEAPDAVRDLQNFMAELLLSDLAPLENRKDRLKKESGRDKEKALIEKCMAHLGAEQSLSTLELSVEDARQMAGFGLLTLKPLVGLLNQEEADFPKGIPPEVKKTAEGLGLDLMGISGKIEMDIGALPPEEQAEFLKELGLESSARDRFIRHVYTKLDLIAFITTGPDESRAWTINRGTTAHRAAGRIHSDIERGFIRAEVIASEELISLGNEAKARAAGKLRLEGKEYVVKDGDVIEFRFNV